VGVGEGLDGAGDVEGAGVARFARFGVGRLACFGIVPDGLNDTSFGAATVTGVTADGAAALSPPPPAALPMPNATPNATTTAATAIAAKRPGVIGRCRSRRS
jgi:hypothetical protein